MDANDEKRINEQLNLLEENQQATKHAVMNQLSILNETIAHVDKLENIIQYNCSGTRRNKYTENKGSILKKRKSTNYSLY